MRVFGDTHGYYTNYLNNADQSSLHLGDVGFDYSPLSALDPEKHKCIAGNHDNLNNLSPHFLPRFGIIYVNNEKCGYISGERSIDWRLRTPMVDWWENEELSNDEWASCLSLFEKEKPTTIFAHGCPAHIIPQFSTMTYWNGEKLSPSKTAYSLLTIFQLVKPVRWFFGHYHNHKLEKIDDCLFQCVGVDRYVDI